MNVHVCWIVLLLASRWIGCNVAAAPVGWWADTSATHSAYACSRGLWRSEEISNVSQVMHETDRTFETTSSVYCVKKREKQLLSKPRHWKNVIHTGILKYVLICASAFLYLHAIQSSGNLFLSLQHDF